MDLPLIDVVLLAGGRGERLGGVTKPLLRGRDGQTLLARNLEAYGSAGRVVVLAPAPLHEALSAALALAPGGRTFGAVPPLASGHRVELLEDPGQGPGQALAAALPHLRGEWTFLAAADHPAPAARLCTRLYQAAQGRDGAQVFSGGQAQPMPGMYRRAALKQPARSLRAWLAALDLSVLGAESLTPEERAALVDVDTPEDLARSGLLPPG